MSVRKRTWKTSTGEPREAWVVAYSHNGKSHIETFRRRKDADARHAEVKVNTKAGIHVPPSKSITLEEAGRTWINAAEGELERTTVDQYRQHLNYHLLPFIGALRLTDVTTDVVLHLEARLRKEGRSKVMARKVLVTLGSILADAQIRKQVGHNAVRELRNARGRHSVKREKAKLEIGKDIPCPAEVAAILANARPKWRPFLVTASFTGLRASELRGLRWSDVDFETG